MTGTRDELIGLPLDELCAMAREVRARAFGNRVTYSPKVFIPLTRLCRDRCGYCTFATAPARLEAPYLDVDEVLAIARHGASAGCREALFTLGEAPEKRYLASREWLGARAYTSTVDYLADAAARVTAETGLLCHANAGALGASDLARLRVVAASQGMMLETVEEGLACHRGAPDKDPARRLATLRAAGELAIPFTTGILVGIGETRRSRLASLEAIAEAHRRYGHVQEVIVQNFVPHEATAMSSWPACSPEEMAWSVAVARLVLPETVHLQAPPNLSDDPRRILDAGIDDWGGVSPITIDYVNPDRSWPTIAALAEVTEAAGLVLAPRLTIYPEMARDPRRWLDPALHFAVLDASDAEGCARDHPWCSGGTTEPPLLAGPRTPYALSTRAEASPITAHDTFGPTLPVPQVPQERSSSRAARREWDQAPPRQAVQEILDAVARGEEADEDALTTLFSARGHEVGDVVRFADSLREAAVGNTVTYVANRNINYTNICTFKCRFCAFSKGPLSLNLRGDPYLLELDEITRRVAEAEARGATEVCLQGGIHPSFDGEYYLEVLKAVRAASERIHVHGFTALEVTEGARRLGEPLASYLQRLKDAGLKTLPGTAAEILDDEIRAILCPDKISTDEWLEAHRAAHKVGLRSNVTIMFGSVESPRHWARHLVRTRALQKETGGFTELVPLPFVHMGAPIYLQRRSRRGPTFREALLVHAVGRIAYRGWIDNIQVSWVKMGVSGARQMLLAGANDLGGTLMDENISRAAGAVHGQEMDAAGLHSLVEPLLGRRLAQRTTLYAPVEPCAATSPL